MKAQATPPPTRARRRYLAAASIIVIAGLAGCGNSSPSPEREARSYISSRGHTISVGKAEAEHVATLVSGSEIIQGAQKAYNDFDRLRHELFDREASKKLRHATFELSESANELKNEMILLIAYIRNSNYAAVERLTKQREAARRRWNAGVEEIWHIANESGAMTFR
jgi:hypothetical protein